MTDGDTIREGQILTGPLFSEPMRVETVAANGPAAWTLGLVGTQTERFRRVALTKDQLATLTITSPAPSYAGDGGSVRLGLQAYALGIAWEFDPYFGLSVSRVDPLPHAESGNDYFSSETSGWNNLFRLGPQKSALANLPEDETKFPVATWFKELLMAGLQALRLNSEQMRRPSPPKAPRVFLPDGSTLPWVVDSLARKHKQRFATWIGHVRTALPDLKQIRTVERSEDRHRYLVIEYENGLKVPSWVVSDGTLRLLALTLLAHLPDVTGVFLIEEPENGIHPRAVESVFQSLSSVYGAQVLLATHSPVVLSIAKPEQILCFAKTPDGATDVVRGSDHPGLKTWKGETDLGTLFASGVLG